MKRKILDFLCAFAVSAIVFLSLALVSSQSFFDGVAELDKDTGELTLFGTTLTVREDVLAALEQLLKFNDSITFDGFSDKVMYLAEWGAGFAKDAFGLCFYGAKNLVGAGAE